MFEETFPLEFGPYKLLEKIGQGGMAEIFRAESYGSQGFVKELALKRILSSLGSNQDFVTQFLDEARIAGSLSHPNIVQIYDVGHVNEAYYIAMEYVNGKHLGQMIRSAIENKQPVPFHVAALIIKDVAQALHFAHSAKDSSGEPMNIVHRDISPQNILVDYHGAIKLTDFGIAKAANKLFQTTAGVIKGKFSYLAPEQLIGQGASAASDLFSLGVVFWEMLSGRRLFQGESDIKTIQLVQACDVPLLTQYRQDIPTNLVEIIGQLLTSNPQYRYQDASMLVRDLSYFLTNNGIPEGPSQISNFMGQLYPNSIRSSGVAPTKASMPAISMDDLPGYTDDSTQNQLSSFEDARTPVATEAELTNPNQSAWPDGMPEAKRPASVDQFDDDIQTAAIDMSPLLTPSAFEREAMDTAAIDASGLDTSGVDLSLLDKVNEAAEAGMEETAALIEREETIPQNNDDRLLGDVETSELADSLNIGVDAHRATDGIGEDDDDETDRPQPSPVGKQTAPSSNRTFVIIVVLLLVTCAGVWGSYFFLFQKKRSQPIKPAAVTSATLEVQIDPPQARVTINGLAMDGSPNLRTQGGLVGGLKYRVHASLKGYRPVRMAVTLKGKVSRVSIKLKKR